MFTFSERKKIYKKSLTGYFKNFLKNRELKIFYQVNKIYLKNKKKRK